MQSEKYHIPFSDVHDIQHNLSVRKYKQSPSVNVTVHWAVF